MRVNRFKYHRLAFLLLLLSLSASSGEARWVSIGPFGGDVRSLVSDPNNPEQMYLGTRTGQIFFTKDGGKFWSRLTGLNAPADWVVDSLSIDPTNTNTIYAGMWSLRGGGGIYKTTDTGISWKELDGISGQSVRALVMAPSAPRILVAGSLEGVFRSEDAGMSWRRISPVANRDLRNVESIAIDPKRPEIIYAGTWHLPWKTVDGGAHWVSIDKGIIDDSDIFSMIVDPSDPQVLYATTCSGIYRSDTAGASWRKIQGIPYSSRRTRSLALDPRYRNTLYAGTTEGLWRTEDGGVSWKRLTSPTWVINAIAVDSSIEGHFYLGMDQSGVMESRDGGRTFQAANRGFAQRLVSRIVPDPTTPGRFYAALVQDGSVGGVSVTEDDGATWAPAGSGLEGRDVSSLLVITHPAWRLLAGTDEGIYERTADQPAWQNNSRLEIKPGGSPVPITGLRVRSLYRRNDEEPIYALTSVGVLVSNDGRLWRRLLMDFSRGDVYVLTTGGNSGKTVLASTSAGLKISQDSGRSWATIDVDDEQGRIQTIVSHPGRPDVFFVGTSTGLFRSSDAGESWEKFGHGLPFAPVREVVMAPDDPMHILVVGSAGLFQSVDGGDHYSRLGEESGIEGLPIQLLAFHPGNSHPILAASPYNGLFEYDGAEAAPPLPPKIQTGTLPSQ